MPSAEEPLASDEGRRRRRAFAALSFKLCYECGHAALAVRRLPAGCRCLGGEYGTQVFACVRCSWTASFLYDEQGDLFFHETRHWNLKSICDFPPHYVREWLIEQGFPAAVGDAVAYFDLSGDDMMNLKIDGLLNAKLNIGHQTAAQLSLAISAAMPSSEKTARSVD